MGSHPIKPCQSPLLEFVAFSTGCAPRPQARWYNFRRNWPAGNFEKWLARYARLTAWMQGTPPDVPIRAYDWNDYELVRRWFSSLGDLPEKSVLFVCPEDSRLRS